MWALACALALSACDCIGLASQVVPDLDPGGVHVVSDTPLCPFEVAAAAPGATWSPTGPPGASVQALLALGQGTVLVGTGSSRSTGLMASAGGGLYRSTDDGKTVSQVMELAGTRVNRLVAAPDGTVYAAVGSLSGAGDDGVWRSTDRGATFTRFGTGLHTGARVAEVAVAGGTPSRLYALVRGTPMVPLSAAAMLYRKDGAADWVPAAMGGVNPTPGGPVTAIATDSASDRLYAVDGARLYVSTDGGESFTELTQGWLGNPRSLSVLSPGRLLLGTAADGLFETTDDGVTWTQRLALVEGELRGVMGVSADPQGRVFIASQGAGLQRLEGGQATVVGKCLVDAVVLAVAAAPDSASTVYAGTNGGLYVSDNGGDSFLPGGAGLSELLGRVKVAVLDGQPTLFLMSSAGLFYYQAATGTWQRQGDWAETVAFSDITMNADGTGGFLSVDEEFFPGRYSVAGGLWRWRRSEHLVEKTVDLVANVGAVALDPSLPGRTFAYQRGGGLQPPRARTGVHREATAGSGFVETSLLAEHLEGTSTFRFSPLAVAADGTVYAGARLADASPALFRSSDQGLTHQQVWNGPGWVAYGVYVSASGDVFLTGWLQDIGIRKSTDRGATFTPADTGLSGFSKFVYALTFEGATGVVVGTQDGVHYAADGVTYAPLNQGFSTAPQVWSVAVLPAQPRPVVVAGTSHGVYWRTLP